MSSLTQALAGVTKLGFDTAPIIYFIEANPRYDVLMVNMFQRVAQGSLVGITSAITLTEVLVQPLRRGDVRLQHEYREFLVRTANFSTLPVDAESAEQAAVLRARHNLRTPDALQIAVSHRAGCQAFLTNDRTLQRVTELRVLVLDDLSP